MWTQMPDRLTVVIFNPGLEPAVPSASATPAAPAPRPVETGPSSVVRELQVESVQGRSSLGDWPPSSDPRGSNIRAGGTGGAVEMVTRLLCPQQGPYATVTPDRPLL
ncbi:unnamed protein product [Rangifer tarandus platyrhynchus]|uniref:Uncharacterized protein n=2 Tax=Rangifer tarandus platyrhynchus TaxID=3082113 RepID=A0ABN8ZXB0_RANTA|nr:unnamed protein product [Rangifer tarandus platyrhynchus]CAI9711191.1 unnamed protein product [Rangifer tarandus platyrhynchus]